MSATGQIWKMNESFKHCPGKMTYFHSPSRQVHITRLCWTWLSSKENNLSWPFNGCLWVHNRSFICTVSLSDAQVLFRPHSVVHTPLWCKALSSSHKHPPATNTPSSGAPAGDFPTAVVCGCRVGRGRPQMPDFPPPPVWFYTVIFIYWSLEVSIYSTKASSVVHTGGLETVKICYPLF